MTAESGFKETVEPEDVVFESVVHLLTRATAHRLKAPPEPEGDATPTPKPSNTKPQIRHHGPPPPQDRKITKPRIFKPQPLPVGIDLEKVVPVIRSED